MKRHWIIRVHLVVAAVFLPFLLLMPLSGSLYLLDKKGDIEKTEAFRVSKPNPIPEDLAPFFREQFHGRQLDFEFEYIKTSGADLIFRPSSRSHYIATAGDTEWIVYWVQPTLVRKMMELHKGHGPKWMRTFEMIFGFALLLITFSGLWLAVTMPKYRYPLILSFALGTGLMLLALN